MPRQPDHPSQRHCPVVHCLQPKHLSLTKDSAMTTVTPTSSGGTVVSWSISPSLPAGLVFDNTTGAISGTPTVVSSSTSYTVQRATPVAAPPRPSPLKSKSPSIWHHVQPQFLTAEKGTSITRLSQRRAVAPLPHGRSRLLCQPVFPSTPRLAKSTEPQRPSHPQPPTRSRPPTLAGAAQPR